MTHESLFTSIRAGDLARVQQALATDGDLDARDEHGWTALCWAAGGGHQPIVAAVLARGANPRMRAADGRTPREIARAARHRAVARLLAAAEAAREEGGATQDGATPPDAAGARPYCRAYLLRDLRRFPAWTEPAAGRDEASDAMIPDETVVFVHRDFSVTRTVATHGETPLRDGGGEAWRRFCADTLGFVAPDETDEAGDETPAA